LGQTVSVAKNGAMATISEALAIALRHHQAGQLQSAEWIYRQVLQAEPDNADAIHLLGLIAHQTGRLAEAVACYRRVIELQPGCADVHSNLGNALKELGKLDEAAACCRRALELKPDLAEAHNNLGNTLRDQGKPDEAAACYLRALALKRDFAEAHNNLGIVFEDQGKPAEAAACCRRALELKPGYAEAHNNLGVALKAQEKPREAAACYRRALELKPDFAEAHGNLGAVLVEMGDLVGAQRCFRTALQYNPRFAFAHYKLAELLGGKLPAEELSAARRLLEDPALADAPRLLLHFGLAQILDARGQYAEAARHLDRANALEQSERRKQGREYDPIEHASFIARMIAACTPDFFRRVRGFGSESELPVFVVGLPRSGTTLVEQILAGHPRVFAAGEIKLVNDTMAALGGQGGECTEGLRRLDRPTALRLASRHLERLRALDPAALRIVDKLPENYFCLGPLASLFPRAKFIHCRRDVRDVAVSCWMTHFREVRWANSPEHIVSRFLEYRRVIEHWRKVLPVPWLDVDYEETVADLEGVARKLVAWCGLPWEPSCLAFHQGRRRIGTASAVQVRQPVYQTSVGRWRHYEQVFAPWLARLAPPAKREPPMAAVHWDREWSEPATEGSPRRD
jgi:tetratricopeptide (TPR) repeat protein